MPKKNITVQCPDVQGFNDQDFLDIALKELSFYAHAANLSSCPDDYDEPHILRVYTRDDKILKCKVDILGVSLVDRRLGQVCITGRINLGPAGRLEPDNPEVTTAPLDWYSKFTMDIRRGLLMSAAQVETPQVP